MSLGRMAYVLKIGQRARPDSLIDIFEEELQLDNITTYREQFENFKTWLESIR